MFDKHPSGLDWEEAAIAAALVRGPNANAATVAQRACGILKLQSLGCDGIAARTELALSRRGTMPLGEQLAPHFARQVIRRHRRDACGTDARRFTRHPSRPGRA